LTASRQEVVVFLYEGAIGYLQRAAKAWDEDKKDQATVMVDRAISIVVELSESLNYAAGDRQLTLRLDSIYGYLIKTLNLAVLRDDKEALKSCEGILETLHDAWRQAVEMTRGVAALPTRGHGTRLQVSA
jgi:flagellar protein FliS